MTTSSSLYPRLNKSYKNTYPFKLATTSFIYPDKYGPNVDLLGPFLDEIEILFFESPGQNVSELILEMQNLEKLGMKHSMSYNIHLPLDVSVSATDSTSRHKAVDEIQKVFTLTSNLHPSTYTLHLPCSHELLSTSQDIKDWQLGAAKGLELLLASGIDSRKISIETLEYPFEWAAPLIRDFDLSACIDFGHLIVNGYNVEKIIHEFAHRTTIIHLHGATGSNDHLPLNVLSPHHWKAIGSFLLDFKGIVSLEVFSFEHLERSLRYLHNFWQRNSG